MAQQLSTAFSDLVLAVSCMYCIRNLMAYSLVHKADTFNYAKTGLSLILVASSLGVVKFGMSSSPGLLSKCHRYMSFLASVMGLSCLAIEFYHCYRLPYFGQIHLYASVAVVMFQVMGNPKIVANLSAIVSSAALIAILIVSAVYHNWLGCIGSAVAIISGAVFQAGWRGMGFPSDDYLHYGLVIMNYCLSKALIKK